LAPRSRRLSDLMDRQFTALKATDDQETAAAVFRQRDRLALPVTDSAGMLIGIVTIDDVLHVVEAGATEDIQRLGGTEALDEPYMKIAFGKMIRKRAGWLDRKSTRLNSSHSQISYAVFCLKKKNIVCLFT